MPKSKNYVPTNKELDAIRDRYIEQGGRITKCPDGVAHGVVGPTALYRGVRYMTRCTPKRRGAWAIRARVRALA